MSTTVQSAAKNGATFRPLAAILLLVAPLYIFGMFQHDLWRPAEAREAGIAREMIENGNWVATHLGGQLFLEKPPLYTWALAAPLLIFGYQDWAVRLPVLAFTLATFAVVFFYARRRLGVFGAQATVAVFATMELCVEVNHGAMIDNGLVFFVVCAMSALDRLREPNGANGILFVLLFYVALAGAFLCKGFVGPVLIMAAAGVYRLIARDRSFLPRLRPALGFVVLALLIGPYLFCLWQRGGAEYFNILFVQNHLRRFTGEEGPSGSLFYYVPHLFAATLPWCLLLPPALWAVWRNWPGYHPNRKRAWFFDCGWVIGMFALLSIAGSKDNQYLLPLLPPSAVLFGDWAQESGGMNVLPRWALVFHWLFGAVILLVLISLPWLSVWTGQAARPGALLVAVVVAAFVGRAMLALARSDFRLWWKRLLWLPALAGLGLPFFVEAPLNVSKSIRPLSSILDGIYCRDNRLFAYDPSENTIGALVFYGWRPVPINDNLHLAKLAREPEPAMVMIQSMDGTHPIIDDLLSAGAWFFASSAEVGDRVFVFLKNRAAADVLKDQP